MQTVGAAGILARGIAARYSASYGSLQWSGQECPHLLQLVYSSHFFTFNTPSSYNIIREALVFRVIREMPCCEERGTRDVGQLGIVDGVRLVRRLVVVGLCVGVIPDDRHTLDVERTLVAASYGVVPLTIAGVELERISVDVVLEPVAERRMSVSIEET